MIMHNYIADFKNLPDGEKEAISDFTENAPTVIFPDTSNSLPQSDFVANTVIPKASGINYSGNPLPVYNRMCSTSNPIKVLEQSESEILLSDSQTHEEQQRVYAERERKKRYFEAYNRFSKVKTVADYIYILEWYRQQKKYVENLLSMGQPFERENLKLELLEWGRVEQELLWIIEKRRIPKTLVSIKPGPPKCS